MFRFQQLNFVSSGLLPFTAGKKLLHLKETFFNFTSVIDFFISNLLWLLPGEYYS